MYWRDFLYFSKGEKQALTLLLCLITIGWIILQFADDPSTETNNIAHSIDNPVVVSSSNNPADHPVELHSYPSSTKATKSSKPGKHVPLSYTSRQPATPRRFADKQSFTRTEKYPPGTIVELNTADTTVLKKVPGIGSSFANRIVKFRNLLGGFHSVSQLGEVYGIDEERYEAMKSWFIADSSLVRKLAVNHYPADSFPRHPYLSHRQARAILQLKRQHGQLSGWQNLQLLEEFTTADRQRLEPYLSFE